MAEEDQFTNSIDTLRLERLFGEIMADVSAAEQRGYTNMEIARALLRASFDRAQRDFENYESFLYWQVDETARALANARIVAQQRVAREKDETLN